jgi:hypothetical protein
MDRFDIALGKIDSSDSLKKFLKETEYIEETAMDRDDCSSCEIMVDPAIDCEGCPSNNEE